MRALWIRIKTFAGESPVEAGLAAVAIAAWVFVPFLVPLLAWLGERVFGDGVLGLSGQFGDQYGTVGALFSAGAFIAVLYGLHLQRRDRRDDAERDRQQDALRSKEIFEKHFYEMLAMLEALRGQLVWVSEGDFPRNGREALRMASNDLCVAFRPVRDNKARHPHFLAKNLNNKIIAEQFPMQRDELDQKKASELYEWIHKHGFGSRLGHILRMTYVILREIDECSASDKNKYARVLRATISAEEAVILFYNSLAFGRARDLLLKYRMFHVTPATHLADPAHAEWYPGAFAQNEFE